VARKVSLQARNQASRHRPIEVSESAEASNANVTLGVELRELQSLIREEVDRLSSHDRMAVVLCYLEGMTHEDAADQLGWPVGTVKGRLSRAREKLKGRLSRRGVTLPTVFVANASRTIPRFVSPKLIQSTTLAALRLAAGSPLTAGMVSAQALILMEGVIGTMFATKLKIAAIALGAAYLIAVPGVNALQSPNRVETKNPNIAASKPVEQTKKTAEVGTELPDSSPESLAKLSEEALQTIDRRFMNGEEPAGVEKMALWSRRLAEAKSAPNLPEADRRAALQAHFDRMKKTLALAEQMVANEVRIDAGAVLEARYRVIEAADWVRAGRVGFRFLPQQAFGITDGTKPAGAVPAGGGGAFGGADTSERPLMVIEETEFDETKNEAIRNMLELLLPMRFATETSLQDVKKYIQRATQDEKVGLPTGIPIYFDPDGLQDADKTMNSTISIDLEGIPLRTTLQLLLRQVGLNYRVTGGLLYISDETSIQEEQKREKKKNPPGGFR
jgi:hypothetical protein